MNKEELIKIDLELRSLGEKVKSGEIKVEDGQKRLDELKIQKRDLERQIALADVPTETRNVVNFEEIRKAMTEKRAITLNGTGLINQIRELVKELQRKREILNLVRYFHGPNASTNIPVWSPTLATPASQNEGAKDIAADTQATLGSKSITPKAYVSILPVSAEALTLGSVNLESELATIFADAFADGFAKGVVQGDGTFDGLFQSLTNNITCAASGAPKVADLVTLALTVKDFTDDAIIVMNQSVYSQIMADATTGVAQLYKEELIRSKTIEGVKVLLTGYAPSSISAGSTVAVAGRMSDYGIGLASEITIEPIKQVGDTNVYYQAIAFANGTKILNKNFTGLVTA